MSIGSPILFNMLVQDQKWLTEAMESYMVDEVGLIKDCVKILAEPDSGDASFEAKFREFRARVTTTLGAPAQAGSSAASAASGSLETAEDSSAAAAVDCGDKVEGDRSEEHTF